jgi:arginyl-tRNA synthetase
MTTSYGAAKFAVEGFLHAATERALRDIGLDANITLLPNPGQGPGGHIVTFIDESGGAEPTTASRELAERLVSTPGIQRAVAIPPRVFVTIDDNVLRAEVVQRVRAEGATYGQSDEGNGRVLCLDFSNPNANKPLHIGHLRNNYLGMALAEIAAARGYSPLRLGMFSDWGVHIAETVHAYAGWAGDETPCAAGLKPDHFVGEVYARFHADRAAALDGGDSDGVMRLDQAAQDVLVAMDAGTPEVIELARRLTGWACAGITATYERIGSRFDVTAYESASLDTARQAVADGVASGVLARRADGSTYLDLAEAGLGELTVSRGDGTLIVYAQWLGSEVDRFRAHPFDERIVVIGREWELGSQSYRELVGRLGYGWPLDVVFHGMVNLPDGHMKSRTGTAVSADDAFDRLVADMPRRWADLPDSMVHGVAADRFAVALTKLHLLRPPRMNDVAYTEDALWNAPARLLLGILEVSGMLAGPSSVLADSAGSRSVPPARLRKVLCLLDQFGIVVERAERMREPSVLVRYVEQIVRSVREAAPAFAADPETRDATAAVLRRALTLLNVELPT